jgi:cephalosporin hydroxylase
METSTRSAPSLRERLLDSLKQLYLRFYTNPRVVKTLTNQFHRMYYHTPVPVRTWENTYWLGRPVLKCPLDLWIYQEILHETRPDVIVECGTAGGGSAWYFACLMDLIGNGRVVTIDLGQSSRRPRHERITYLTGSSVAPEMVEKVRSLIGERDRVMVVLDSDHSMPHVLEELRTYKDLVSPGSYLAVEDTCINGHPVVPLFGPGPWEAVDEFLRETDAFVRDTSREKFFLTFNPGGYLKRVK